MFEFLASGQYKIILGKSFDVKSKKKALKYFHVKSKDSLDARQVVYGNEAKLEKKKDKYQVEMKRNSGSSVVYEAELNAEEEYNCILIYNEETKTITIERQSAQINLVRKKVDSQQPQQNGHLTQSPLPGNQYTNLQTPPIVKEPIKEDNNTNGTVTTPTAAVPADDFDFDLSKDMDEILDSDDEEEGGLSGSEEGEDGSDTFEEIATAPIPLQQHTSSPLSLPVTPSLPPSSPNIPLNLALPTTPNTSLQSSAAASPANSSKKRKFKMASAPIRHPGTKSPLAVAATPPATTLTPPAAVVPPPIHMANKRLKSQHDDSSSSGSEEEDSSSGSEDESGSTETGSSSGSEEESGSESDDIFESLEQDISMSLSKGGPSAPGSPQQQQQASPYMTTTPGHTPTPSINNRSSQQQQNGGGGPGPMSLRALFNENDEEEEGSSSSESEDSD